MAGTMAERFIDALGKLEGARDAGPLVELHADDAEVGNVHAPEKFHGRDGARAFWGEYRETFDELRSEFRNVIESDGRVALEWTTGGSSVGGKPVRYDGVSVIEYAGDRVTRFRAYFDPGALGRQIAE